MNYNSLREFFYKLYNICLAMMFFPIGSFLIVYYLLLTNKISPTIQGETVELIILVSFPILTIVDLTIVHLVVRKKFLVLSKEVSLGIRLEKYFSVAVIRMSTMVATSLFMAAGLFLTGSEWFAVYFLALIVWLIFYWPTPGRVSKDLALRGDEAEMVLTKGEAFK
jgi:branched-subunit amino acid transport protein